MTDPRITIAQHLTAIVEMSERLEDQAINDANDSLMPGGLAMVALSSVANLEAWSHKLDAAERRAIDAGITLALEDSDEDWIPPLQTLLFWSEDLRREHDLENEARPTIASEANVIRWALDWLWENEAHWDDFAKDVSKARFRLEDLLKAGERAERGVPCLYETCGGVRLVRKMTPARDPETGAKIWRHTDWHCPRCKRSWDEERYAAMVTAANERTKAEEIGDEIWCALDYAARKVGRSVATIRTWLHRGEIGAVCIIAGRRKPFVNLAEVEARHAAAKKRAKRVA